MSGKKFRDTIGFLGVIGSLVFVGVELQQNNKLAQAAAFQAIGIASAAAWDTQANNADFLAMQLKSPDELTATDWLRHYNKFTVWARLAETTLLQVQSELLEADAMETLGFSGWGDIFDPSAPNYAGPVAACVWPQIRPAVSDSFRAYVERGRDTDAVDCSPYDLPWEARGQ